MVLRAVVHRGDPALLLVAVLSSVACARPSPTAPSEKTFVAPEPVPASSHRETVPAAEAVPAREPEPLVHHGIAWYRDDAKAALSRARRDKKLVAVDLWAPWCHTCLSMQEYVLTKEKLGSLVERFVFLSIDTERETNAEILRTLTLSAWPTFYVLSPREPFEVRARWVGGASVGQFARFLADGERAEELAGSGGAAAGEPLALLVKADALAASGDFRGAAAAYGEALRAAPRDWARRSDTLVARASALRKGGQPETCADMANGERPGASDPVSLADFAANLLACAGALPESDKRVARTRKSVVQMLAPLCEQGHPDFTPDDRGDACGTLIEARESLKDSAGAQKALRTRLALLEAAASGVPDDVAVMYDFAQTETLVKLGRGTEAVALLEARERALPDNYNPPHYLARVHRALKRWDEGLAAIDRALRLAYGPRRAGLMTLKVELLRNAGRRDEARRALEEQLRLYRELPEGQKRPDAERRVKDELAAP
jgi:tetratricopeptide (TPR) repeat protein